MMPAFFVYTLPNSFMPHTSPIRSSHRGFTMVELVVTVVLIGILAATAMPRFFKKQTFDARGFSDQVASMVRYAQKIAVAQQRKVFVRLNGADVAICFDVACTLPVNYPAGSGPASCGGNSTWFCVTAPNGIEYSSTQAIFYFNALGQPVATNNAVLGANVTITIKGDTADRVLTVNAETGYVQS
ncbi:pilus assembly FimT family protein [Noviherbaspirillum sp. ST9]|uniref:pilus assembly FimT family protein n=1 Tax=Noviherbaspirillum sp. ST9 TaxID=3401606 RepID=UPI003B589215